MSIGGICVSKSLLLSSTPSFEDGHVVVEVSRVFDYGVMWFHASVLLN